MYGTKRCDARSDKVRLELLLLDRGEIKGTAYDLLDHALV
jgi:hypothetical protein